MADDREAQRHDSFSLSGLVQSLHWRTDRYKNLQFDLIPHSQKPNWEAFIDAVITGQLFQYYPDATQPGYTVYLLADAKWAPSFLYIGHSKVKMRVYKVVGPDQTGS